MSDARGRGPPGRTSRRPDAPIFGVERLSDPRVSTPSLVGGDPNQEGFRVRDLTPPDRLTLDRLRRRREMVRTLDGFATMSARPTLTATRDQFADKAYDLLTSSAAQSAFKMADEPPAVRDRYGRNPFGQTCLLARRLVEARRLVRHRQRPRHRHQLGWDTHAQNFPMIKNQLAPPLDQGVSALIEDLHARGRLKETLVVMVGEFGRTPKINPNAGRDHHGRANVAPARRRRDAGRGWCWARPTPRGDIARSTGPVHPERPRRDDLHDHRGSTPTYQFETPTAGRSGWSTGASRSSEIAPPRALIAPDPIGAGPSPTPLHGEGPGPSRFEAWY